MNERKRKNINEADSIHISKLQRSKFIEIDADFMNKQECLRRVFSIDDLKLSYF